MRIAAHRQPKPATLKAAGADVLDDRDEVPALEVLHRQHACVEDRIRELKNTGLSKLPFGDFEPNEAWLELALTAHTLTAWTQALLLDGEHQICEPKRLR